MKWLWVLAALVLPVSAFASHNVSTKRVHSTDVLLPLVFEANAGQAPSAYQFVSHNAGLEALFSPDAVDFRWLGSRAGNDVRLGFIGSRHDVVPQGRDLLPSVSNYLLGNDPSRWVRGVRNQSEVVYSGLYPGIDLVFHGKQNEMEHDFRISPRANPNVLRFVLDGASRVELDRAGNLKALTSDGTLTLQKPQAYQEFPSGRRAVQTAFVLRPDRSVQFQVGKYDRHRELVIDPVLSFSTYLAGNSADYPTAVTVDPAGNVYVTGYTFSLDFPIAHALESSTAGSPSAFVSKLDSSGHTLLYSTYLGGSSRNYGHAIALDSSGDVIVAGTSSSNDFPHLGSVPSLTCGGNNDCFFLVSLKPNGSAFNYAGLIGGIEGTDVVSGGSGSGALAVDLSGNAYLASVTDDANFQITPGTLAPSGPGYPYNSAFVLKASRSGALLYSTIIPGTEPANAIPYVNVFIPTGISVDAGGRATIAGTAGPGLPSTAGVVQPTFPNSLTATSATAGFVLQLNAKASAINYATYLRGTDTVGGLAVDAQGNSYVTGGTGETNLPVSGTAYQKKLKPGQNCTCNSGFVLKLNPSGKAVLAASYLEGTPTSGNGGTSFTGIALDGSSNVFVGGMTASTDFPLKDPFVSLWVYGDSVDDMVIAAMSPDLSTLKFGTFLSSTDQVFPASQFGAITVGAKNNPVVVGYTSTTDFPTTSGSFQPVPPSQAFHPFIAEFNMAVAAPSVCLDNWNVNFGQVPAKTSSLQTVHLTNCGNSPLNLSLVSSVSTVVAKQTCGTIAAGAVCPITLTFKPTNSSSSSGRLTLKDNAQISPQVLQFSGQGVAPRLSPFSELVGFGHLLVHTTGARNQLIFQNDGNASLQISSASVDGNFSITGNSCVGTQLPGSLCAISVTFSPTAAGIRTGTLTINSNDPIHPHAGISLVGTGDSVYAIPIISSLSSPSAQIKSGPITFQVYGSNFYPASVVEVNGAAKPTTYVNPGELQVTLGSTVSNAVGEVSISIHTPTPGGGTSVGLLLTRFEALALDAAVLSTVPGTNLIYASIPASAPANPNTVISVNPVTGAFGKPIPVGKNPGLLAASTDGSYLFVVSNQGQTVQRINLSTKSVEKTFRFPPNSTTCCGALAGTDLKGVPGSPREFVLSVDIPGYGFGEMALYNDSGLVNYIPSSYAAELSFSSFTYAGNPTTIYALPFTNAQNPFFNIVDLAGRGLQYTIPGCCYLGNNTTGAEVVSDGTLLYTSAGQVWSPATHKQTGSFPVTTYNDTSYPNLHNLVLDKSSGHLFVIGDQPYQADSSSLVLSGYDKKSLKLSGALAFPQVADPLVNNLVRWGTNGFAFLAQNPAGNAEAVYLLTSSLANSVASNPVPNVRSIAPSSAPQKSIAFQLTLNGAGFTEASVVHWNGVPLPSTFVSTTVLTAAVPAAKLSTNGVASITVTNPVPGGGTSNAAHFTVAPRTPLISFSSTALSFPARAVGTTSLAQGIAVENPGTATLTVSGIKITGSGATSFHETHTCGSGLAAGANCRLSVTFKPTAKGNVSALLTVTDNGPGSPQTILLHGAGE